VTNNERASSASSYGALLDSLRGLRWPARRRVSGGSIGMHRSRRRGTSVEFTEYRDYRQGDELRKLDWKLLARTDRPFIRLADDDALLRTTLILDASGSMAYPTASLEKWWCAKRLTIGLAAVAHATGDPVGLLVAADMPVRPWLPPRTRRGVLDEVARIIDAVQPTGSAAIAPTLAPLRGRIIIVSDFLGDAQAMLDHVRTLGAAGHEVSAVHVVAEGELDPPRRSVLLTDSENGELRRPMTTATRATYLAQFAAWRHELRRGWTGAGAVYTMVRTGERADRSVRRVIAGGHTEGLTA
jgi:uncharacterized protein (DUF58 family)